MPLFNSPVICAVLGGLAWAVLGLAYKVAENTRCRPISYGLVFLLVAGVVPVVRAVCEPTAWGNPWLWGLGLLSGGLLYGGIQLVMAAYRLGPASIVWAVLNLAILVPILLAPLFHERYLWIDPLLLVLFMLMLLAFERSMAQAGETSAKRLAPFLLILAAIFIDNGFFLLGGKVKQALFGDTNSAAFAAIIYLSGLALTVLVEAVRRQPLRISPAEWRAGTLAGVSSGVGTLFFLAAMALPSVNVFSIVLGIALLGGIVLTSIFYRERMNILKVTGLALGAGVLLSAILREPLAARLSILISR